MKYSKEYYNFIFHEFINSLYQYTYEENHDINTMPISEDLLSSTAHEIMKEFLSTSFAKQLNNGTYNYMISKINVLDYTASFLNNNYPMINMFRLFVTDGKLRIHVLGEENDDMHE